MAEALLGYGNSSADKGAPVGGEVGVKKGRDGRFYFFSNIFTSGRGKYNPRPSRISACNQDRKNGDGACFLHV